MTPRYISILGSTGSVGVSTLDLLERATASGAAAVRMKCLVAGQNVALLAKQALQWRPELTVIADRAWRRRLEPMQWRRRG
jgi:1-deoxy-D-xylulose-5-phosphate reductoisomerase